MASTAAKDTHQALASVTSVAAIGATTVLRGHERLWALGAQAPVRRVFDIGNTKTGPHGLICCCPTSHEGSTAP